MEVKPGYKQTEVGVIPEDWKDALLDNFAKRGSGHTPNKKHPEYWNGEIKWISLADSTALDHVFINDTFAKITPAGVANSSAVVYPSGTVVLSRDAGVGKSAIMWTEMAVSQHFMAWRCGSDLDNHFLYYWLQSAKPEFERIANGSTIKTIGLPYFQALRFPCPPVLEQRAIANALSDVDDFLNSLDRLIAKKRDLKQAAMQQLLTGQTRLPGFNGKWKATSLGEVISRFSTGLNPRQNFRLNNGGNFFYVTIKNFTKGRLFLDENCDAIDEAAFLKINERSDLRKNDILFSSIGRVGDAYLILENPRNWNINESVFTLRPDQSKVTPLMLFYLLTDKSMTDALNQGVTGSTFKSIKQAQLKSIRCLIPDSLEEQTAIAEALSEIDTELVSIEQRRDKTIALKQGMMQELLTGRTRLI